MAIAEVPQRLHTSLRSRTSAQTLAVARRLMPRLGVSDVIDATPLDHLRLPVFMSLRPRGKLTQVHSGKGVLPEDAQAGAVMEAVEYAACESASAAWVPERLSLAQLTQQWPDGMSAVDFAPRLGVRIGRRARLAAVRCEILQSRRNTLLPAELVLLPPPKQRSRHLFESSSNGLASGNTLNEATLHALLEVLERDTLALHLARDESQALVLASLPTPFGAMRLGWQRSGVALIVRHLPNTLGLPCFEAAFHDPAAAAPLVLARGWGLHFDRHIALSRAICEAAQSRLAVILSQHATWPGAAFLERRLAPVADPRQTALLLARLSQRKAVIRFENVPHQEPGRIGDVLRWLLSRLKASGLGPVFRYRMHLDNDETALTGLHVVKVVVARSESAVGTSPRLGPRLFARLQGA